eukprot:g37506.t1
MNSYSRSQPREGAKGAFWLMISHTVPWSELGSSLLQCSTVIVQPGLGAGTGFKKSGKPPLTRAGATKATAARKDDYKETNLFLCVWLMHLTF